MKQFLAWIISTLTIDETFYFEGYVSDLKANLEGLKNNKWRNGFFYSYFKNPGHYEICATFSVGTLFPLNVIKIHLLHNPIVEDDYLQEVKLFITIRYEVWLFVIILFVIPLTLVTKDGIYGTLMALSLGFIFLLWFNFILKIQERALVKKIVGRLRLKER